MSQAAYALTPPAPRSPGVYHHETATMLAELSNRAYETFEPGELDPDLGARASRGRGLPWAPSRGRSSTFG